MLKVLVAVDGSAQAERVIDHVIALHARKVDMDVHLLNVQIPVESGHARMFVSSEQVESFHREEGQEALRSVREKLDRAQVPYTSHILVGHIAKTIARFAQEHGFDQIVIGTHGRSALSHLLLGSVATDVLRLSEIPVTMVR